MVTGEVTLKTVAGRELSPLDVPTVPSPQETTQCLQHVTGHAQSLEEVHKVKDKRWLQLCCPIWRPAITHDLFGSNELK